MLDPSWIAAGSQVLSAAVAKQPGYSSAISEPQVNSWLNDSQWTVATGQGTSAKGGAGPVQGLTIPSGSVPFLIAAAVVGLLVWRAKRKGS